MNLFGPKYNKQTRRPNECAMLRRRPFTLRYAPRSRRTVCADAPSLSLALRSLPGVVVATIFVPFGPDNNCANLPDIQPNARGKKGKLSKHLHFDTKSGAARVGARESPMEPLQPVTPEPRHTSASHQSLSASPERARFFSRY